MNQILVKPQPLTIGYRLFLKHIFVRIIPNAVKFVLGTPDRFFQCLNQEEKLLGTY